MGSQAAAQSNMNKTIKKYLGKIAELRRNVLVLEAEIRTKEQACRDYQEKIKEERNRIAVEICPFKVGNVIYGVLQKAKIEVTKIIAAPIPWSWECGRDYESPVEYNIYGNIIKKKGWKKGKLSTQRIIVREAISIREARKIHPIYNDIRKPIDKLAEAQGF